jgi:hypothetical protein
MATIAISMGVVFFFIGLFAMNVAPVKMLIFSIGIIVANASFAQAASFFSNLYCVSGSRRLAAPAHRVIEAYCHQNEGAEALPFSIRTIYIVVLAIVIRIGSTHPTCNFFAICRLSNIIVPCS